MAIKENPFTTTSMNKTIFRLSFSLCIFALLSSCMNVRPGGAKSGKKLYETFFVGDEGTQYFIKPLAFTNERNEELKLDFTFRYRNEIKDSAAINASFISNDLIRNIDSLKIMNNSVNIALKDMTYMFSERKKDAYNNRFSAKTDLLKVTKLFNGNDWQIWMYENGKQTRYAAAKKTEKSLAKLSQEVFVLFK
ncbi:MAG: hypothetical protein MUC59_07190 [Saprospiraceae bacterium]|jgi:hypothetical protein|nr:hypothetical protein [Saprospiraceae bacterium]